MSTDNINTVSKNQTTKNTGDLEPGSGRVGQIALPEKTCKDSSNSKEDTFNEGEHTVTAKGYIDSNDDAAVLRIPLNNVIGISTSRVIVLVPPTLRLAKSDSPEVLFLFHGHGPGNLEQRNPDNSERTNDLHVSHVGQQIAASQQPIIGILAQLTLNSNKKGGSDDHGKDRDIDTLALIEHVFRRLQADNLLRLDQNPGRVLFAGHSAGGRTAIGEAKEHLEEVGNDGIVGLLLYDGHINTGVLESFVKNRLEYDYKQMVNCPPTEQLYYLAECGFFFRSTYRANGYVKKYKAILKCIKTWFNKTTNFTGIDPAAVSVWHNNYRVIKDKSANDHRRMISKGRGSSDTTLYEVGSGHLEHDLSADGERRQPLMTPI